MVTKAILNRGTSVDPRNVPASLKRNELSRQAKREHLASRGVKGADAKDILDRLYGPEPEEAHEATTARRG